MEMIKSTSTEILVNIGQNLRLCGQRHSNRKTGDSIWETWFEKFGDWKVYDNPFDKNDFKIVRKWGKLKGNCYKGVKLAKTWGYKKDIIDSLNQIV